MSRSATARQEAIHCAPCFEVTVPWPRWQLHTILRFQRSRYIAV